MKLYMCVLFMFTLLSCHKKNENIDSMRILYHNTLFESANAIDCSEIKYAPPKNDTLDYDNLFIDYSGVLDTIIKDNKIIEKITIALNQHRIITENRIDARMKCYFTYKNGKVDSLCISDNPIYGMYNNKPVRISNELVYLIRENCGFYKWMGIDQMIYFDELNDTAFVRGKVISRSGEEY